MGTVSAEVEAFIDACVIWKDNGNPPRSAYGYDRFDYAKIAFCNHIPVCESLADLTAYFCGGASAGSTHFGVGRDEYGVLEALGYAFPIAEVHQYMATVGPYAPWAQGVIATSAACPIPPAPILADWSIRSGEPNCAFISSENVAWEGSDGMTDPQFNSNVLLRVWAAQYFDMGPLTPYNQLWHAEIDQASRCSDTGWDGALEDAAQAAGNAFMNGDASLMRGGVAIGPPPTPEPEPEPEPPIATDWQALYVAELKGEHRAYSDDATAAAVRLAEVERKLAEAEGGT